jgi:exodeoxyribonuclease-1
MTATFFCYDYETFGLDPQRDFPAQFAGVRTDAEFNPIDKPITLYCKPSDDYLPQPDACVITGITPQLAASRGVNEAEFIHLINQQFLQARTCTLGYNNLRFDDEVTRNALYRNFHDPYQREWQNGNSRWDLIDVLRATRALRPDGIIWPNNDEGRPSFKLTDLTQANDIQHEFAHDALADVYATLAMARLVKQVQPRLFEFLWTHRLKSKALELLQVGRFQPLLHVSGKYPARKDCLALVVPICSHPTNNNEVVVYDLSVEPTPLLELSVTEIKQRLFTAVADLPEGVERIPLKTVHLNKCPVLAPLSVLKAADAQRLNLDRAGCLAHAEIIKHNSAVIIEKMAQVFVPDYPPHHDPDLMLYSGGFFEAADKAMMSRIRQTPPNQLANLTFSFKDVRLIEMFFRYKARNYPQILTPLERQRWQTFCLARITEAEAGYLQRLNELKHQAVEPSIIQDLENYLTTLKAKLVAD